MLQKLHISLIFPVVLVFYVTRVATEDTEDSNDTTTTTESDESMIGLDMGVQSLSVPETRLDSVCDHGNWKAHAKPFWEFVLKDDWFSAVNQSTKIAAQISNTTTWSSLCIHPTYFTYMECATESSKCICHKDFKDFVAQEGFCKVKMNGKCGSDFICAETLCCLDSKCKAPAKGGSTSFILGHGKILTFLLSICTTFVLL